MYNLCQANYLGTCLCIINKDEVVIRGIPALLFLSPPVILELRNGIFGVSSSIQKSNLLFSSGSSILVGISWD